MCIEDKQETTRVRSIKLTYRSFFLSNDILSYRQNRINTINEILSKARNSRIVTKDRRLVFNSGAPIYDQD
jgi:hypothetical protein